MVDPAELVVAADIRHAETLPAAAFLDRDVLALELDTIFRRAWLLVPEPGDCGAELGRTLADLLAARGARVPFSLGGRRLYAQRGWDDDQLRVFPNTCTHAWYPLVTGTSRGPTLVCGQHGRRFDCNGRFLSQPGFGRDLPNFPRACDHLPTFPAELWRGLVFTRLSSAGPTLRDTLAPLDSSLVRFSDTLERATAPGEVREVAGNWKQHAWNYLDRFHIAFIHRAPGGLADAIDLATYTTEIYSDSVLQWAYATDPSAGFAPEMLPERFHHPDGRRVFALWWYVWPNLTLNYYPWGLSVNVYQPVPERPDRTRFLWYHWVVDRDKHAARDRHWLSAQVDAEDVDALAQVRVGLQSGFAPRGRFAPAEEQAAHWFHHRVAAELARPR